MKNVKKVMPMMAFVLAVGLAFANQANVQTAGWVERNGVPYQLKSEPCSIGSQNCSVIFSSDPSGTIHPVYMDQTLQNLKPDGSGNPYIVNE